MGFDEDPGNTQRYGGPRHDRREFALPAGGTALTARLLHRMGGVHDHRIPGARHDRQGAHIRHQRVVAKADTAFRQKDAAVAGRGDLFGDIRHIPGGKELPLLDVHHRPGFASGQQQVGLTTKKGRDLDDVHHLCCKARLTGIMHICQHRHARRADRFQNLQPGVDPQAPAALQRGAVGLVIAGLEHELRACGRTGLVQCSGDHLGVVQAFQLARPGNHQQGAGIADGQSADINVFHHPSAPACVHPNSALYDARRWGMPHGTPVFGGGQAEAKDQS